MRVAADVQDVVPRIAVRQVQHSPLGRTEDAVVQFLRIHWALHVLHAVVDAVQRGLLEQTLYQNRVIFLHLLAGRSQFFRVLLRELHEAVVLQVQEIEADADVLQRREDVVERHDLSVELVDDALHVLHLVRDPGMIRSDRLDLQQIFSGPQIVVHDGRISEESLVHHLHHVGAHCFIISPVTLHDLFLQRFVLVRDELVPAQHEMMPEPAGDSRRLFPRERVFQKLSLIVFHAAYSFSYSGFIIHRPAHPEERENALGV